MIELVVLVVGVLLSVSIGLFVYARNPHHVINRVYASLTFSLVLFSIANYLSLHTDKRLLFIRAVIFSSTLAVSLLYYLVVLLGEKPHLSFLQRAGVYFTIVVAVLDWTPLVFKGLSGGDNPTPIPNFGAVFFVSHLLVFLCSAFVLLVQRIISSRGMQRLQYIYMIIGISPIFFLAPITGFVIPVLLQNASLIFLSPMYALFFVALIGYAIVRHHLFDIRFLAVRAAAYLTTLFVVTFVLILPVVLLFGYLLDANFSGGQFTLVVLGSVFFLYLFQYLRKVFDRLTAKVFFRHYYDPQDVLGRLGDILVQTADIAVLRSETAGILQEALKAGTLKYTLFADPAADADMAKKIEESGLTDTLDTLDTDEVSNRDKRLVDFLKKSGIAVVVKLRTTHENLGYIVVGYKRSGEGYTDRDKQMLNVAAGEIAIGLQNALRFREIEQFNRTLQQRVDEATRKLRRTNDRLRLLDQTKDDFISMASHQLRTPLTSVKGYVSMVLDGDAGKITSLQRKLLNQSFISSQRMVYLISDLLNVSRLRTGKFVIEAVPTNLAKVIQEEVEQLQETVKGRNLQLTFHKPENFPSLMFDETKLRQVIMNFVDNAIYYTPSGGHITINLVDKPQTVEFTVVDDGIGVPRAEQHRLFSKFYRAPNAQRARPDGTGLGLFMAKKVIVASGGALIFRSQEGHGSTFGFTFAKKKLLAEEPPTDAPAPVADDSTKAPAPAK